MLNTFLIDYVSMNVKNILSGNDFCINHNSLNIFLDAYIPKQVGEGQRDIYSEMTNYVSERRHRSESLARDHGISYPEELVRPARYLKLKPYQFIQKSDDSYSIGRLSFMNDDAIRSYFSSSEKLADLERELEAEARRLSANEPAKKALKKSVRRSASLSGSKSSSSYISGTGMWFSDPVRFEEPNVQYVKSSGIDELGNTEVKSKIDEDNIF